MRKYLPYARRVYEKISLDYQLNKRMCTFHIQIPSHILLLAVHVVLVKHDTYKKRKEKKELRSIESLKNNDSIDNYEFGK